MKILILKEENAVAYSSRSGKHLCQLELPYSWHILQGSSKTKELNSKQELHL